MSYPIIGVIHVTMLQLLNGEVDNGLIGILFCVTPRVAGQYCAGVSAHQRAGMRPDFLATIGRKSLIPMLMLQ